MLIPEQIVLFHGFKYLIERFIMSYNGIIDARYMTASVPSVQFSNIHHDATS